MLKIKALEERLQTLQEKKEISYQESMSLSTEIKYLNNKVPQIQ